MQAILFRLLLVLLVVSSFGVVWVSTGSHVQSGYADCGGRGLYPADQHSSYVDPGGPCLGILVVQTVAGRYMLTPFLTFVLGNIVGLSVFGLILLLVWRHTAGLARNPYVRFVGFPIVFATVGIMADVAMFHVLALGLLATWQPASAQAWLVVFLATAWLLPAVVLLLWGIVTGIRQRKPVLVALILLLLTITALHVLT